MKPKKAILVVDDDDDVRNVLCLVLSAEGYRTVGAADGLEALERLRGAEPPALMVVDRMMPRMDGESLVRHMAEDPLLACIPVAIMSGHSGARDAAWARPVSACLTKPVELDELLSVIGQLVCAVC
jgi:CheY-like chemotaxis protein